MYPSVKKRPVEGGVGSREQVRNNFKLDMLVNLKFFSRAKFGASYYNGSNTPPTRSPVYLRRKMRVPLAFAALASLARARIVNLPGVRTPQMGCECIVAVLLS